MRLLVLLSLLLCLVGCGYNFPGKGQLPAGVSRVYVPLFTNRTAEPLLENRLSTAVSEVFARNNRLTLVESRDEAEAILDGVIRSYSTRAISYDSNDDISEYRAQMQVEARLLQVTDGRLLWQGNAVWDDEYAAADDKAVQEDLEREAIDEISLRIAEELLSRLIDDF
jgi:outer membrane lipopolysaccharide assembly protein LptE/RlpB